MNVYDLVVQLLEILRSLVDTSFFLILSAKFEVNNNNKNTPTDVITIEASVLF